MNDCLKTEKCFYEVLLRFVEPEDLTFDFFPRVPLPLAVYQGEDVSHR